MSIVDEWIAKTEEDYSSAVALKRQRSHPLPNSVCFHCQQCAEKYLKAFLAHHSVSPPRVHDLHQLVSECERVDSSMLELDDAAFRLTQFAVEFRYPGMEATAEDVVQAITDVRSVRRMVRRKLQL